MGEVLGSVLEKIGLHFRGRKVLSEDEFALAVSIELGKLDESALRTLEQEVGADLERSVIATAAGGTGVEGPALLSKIEYMEKAFYHLSGEEVPQEALDAARKRAEQADSPGTVDAVEDIVGAFLSKSGYNVASRPSPTDPLGCRQMRATKAEHTLSLLVLSSINSAGEYAPAMAEDREYVVVVPTEMSPEPFIRFCKEKSAAFAGKKFQVWVVDQNKQVVNPFLGYTRDDDVYRNFDNPALASFACRWYGVDKDLWVRPRL